MNVQAAADQTGRAAALVGLRHQHRPAAGAVLDAAGVPDGEAVRKGRAASPAAEESQGVLRLLTEGHFQGVADVRLRINFQHEIAALQERAGRQAIEPYGGLFGGMFEEPLAALADSAGLESDREAPWAGAYAQYQEAVRQAFAGGPADLPQRLRSAFEQFVTALTDVVTPASEPPAGEAGTDLPGGEPREPGAVGAAGAEVAVELEQYLAAMRAAFEEALANLESDLASAQLLPPLSEPRGRGGAYLKFLAIYGALGSPTEAAGGAAPLDASL